MNYVEIERNFEIIKKLYDYLILGNIDFEYMKDMIREDYRNGYLTLNRGRDGKDYYYYFDGDKEGIIRIEDEEITDDELIIAYLLVHDIMELDECDIEWVKKLYDELGLDEDDIQEDFKSGCLTFDKGTDENYYFYYANKENNKKGIIRYDKLEIITDEKVIEDLFC